VGASAISIRKKFLALRLFVSLHRLYFAYDWEDLDAYVTNYLDVAWTICTTFTIAWVAMLMTSAVQRKSAL
jgi:hypothetical protein